MRITADFPHEPMSRIANIAGNHASILFHAAGIWFALLFSALGTHSHSFGEVLAPDSRNWQTQANEKFNWLFTLLALVTGLELFLSKNRLALPDTAVDYALWINWVVISCACTDFPEILDQAPHRHCHHGCRYTFDPAAVLLAGTSDRRAWGRICLSASGKSAWGRE